VSKTRRIHAHFYYYKYQWSISQWRFNGVYGIWS